MKLWEANIHSPKTLRVTQANKAGVHMSSALTHVHAGEERLKLVIINFYFFSWKNVWQYVSVISLKNKNTVMHGEFLYCELLSQ